MADHGGEGQSLIPEIEEAFARAGMPKELGRSDFDAVRDTDGNTLYVAIDGYWLGLVETPKGYDTFSHPKPFQAP